jgi:hypothetical protein
LTEQAARRHEREAQSAHAQLKTAEMAHSEEVAVLQCIHEAALEAVAKATTEQAANVKVQLEDMRLLATKQGSRCLRACQTAEEGRKLVAWLKKELLKTQAAARVRGSAHTLDIAIS